MFDLFYEEGDPASAKVRAFIEDHQMGDFVRLRDVALDEVRLEWERRGGRGAPALWDGQRWYEGAESALARMRAFLDVGRAD